MELVTLPLRNPLIAWVAIRKLICVGGGFVRNVFQRNLPRIAGKKNGCVGGVPSVLPVVGLLNKAHTDV